MAPVIDVTRLFTTDLPELSVRSRIRARGFDPSRAFVDRAVSFPENIEVEAIHTYTVPPESAPSTTPGPALAVPAARTAARQLLLSARVTPTPDEVRALFRGELKAIDAELRAAPPKAGDTATRRHLDDARAQVALAVDPNRPAPRRRRRPARLGRRVRHRRRWAVLAGRPALDPVAAEASGGRRRRRSDR